MAITLDTIADPGVLRMVWKDIRSHDRKVHLTEAPLVRDSTGGIAFELNLKEALAYLRVRIVDGTYRPNPTLIVESAKSKLLRRRLCFLSLEDALILGALVQAARPSLIEKMPQWVSFGRIDEDRKKTKKKKIITFDYEGWWIKWLRYRQLLKVIEEDQNPLLVISDIVNFFGSVDLSLLRSKVSGATPLDNQSNDLLFYILDRLRPNERYGPRGSFGLPVVPDDTSRILAHFYLVELDQELLTEGRNGRYTRWVDDLVVSVPSEIEGGKVVAKIERSLARIGLVANSSKTALVSKTDFRRYHLEQENDYLDDIHERTDKGIPLMPYERKQFERNLSRFLVSKREGYWSRVLRRYYTESRRVGSKKLLKKWDTHLEIFPSDAQSILDYAAFFSGSLGFCEKLFKYLRNYGPLFQDIQILAYETLLLKPFPNDPILRSYVVQQAYFHYLGIQGFERQSGYIRGIQVLTIYKFGGPKVVKLLVPHFACQVLESPVFATYALPVLAASDIHRKQAFESVEHIEDSRILRIRALIQRLEDGEDRAIGMLLGLLEPKSTKLPERWVINPRALPLVRAALRSKNATNFRRVRDNISRITNKVIGSGDPDLVDWIALDHLK